MSRQERCSLSSTVALNGVRPLAGSCRPSRSGQAMPSGKRIPHTAWINTNITVHRGDPLMFCELSNSRTRLTQPIRNALSTHVKPIFFNRTSVGLKLGGN